jgi:osmotically-inducible protein OsmY
MSELNTVNKLKLMGAIAAALFLSAALPGCALQEGAAKDPSPEQADITTNVRAVLRQHSELGPPNELYVSTHNGVVYLSGLVATPLQRDSARALAEGVPGVRTVVSSVATEQ